MQTSTPRRRCQPPRQQPARREQSGRAALLRGTSRLGENRTSTLLVTIKPAPSVTCRPRLIHCIIFVFSWEQRERTRRQREAVSSSMVVPSVGCLFRRVLGDRRTHLLNGAGVLTPAQGVHRAPVQPRAPGGGDTTHIVIGCFLMTQRKLQRDQQLTGSPQETAYLCWRTAP